MSEFTFEAANESDTDRLGLALAELIPDGTVVALSGTLGAGKTRLVQAIAAASGIDRHLVTSPTFVLCQTYLGRRPIHHFDVYRLKDEQEFLELGPDEYFESDGLSVVEWADKVDHLLPSVRLDVSIDVTGPTQRRFTLRTSGSQLASLTRLIAERLQAG
jgi:tRNA threonylcarbamoyladenosine biosynthesis protein TsaE